jgi:hypothetical protein
LVVPPHPENRPEVGHEGQKKMQVATEPTANGGTNSPLAAPK